MAPDLRPGLKAVNRFHARIGYGAGMTDSVARLYDAVIVARDSDPAKSRTARLLRAGRSKMAKKLAEEAVEVVIDAMHGQTEAVVRESADLLYNLVVLWVHAGIHPDDVWAEMRRRELMFGIAEKLPKDLVKDLAQASPRRKVVALETRRVRKRR
jgi:phosphoribosyl-ATP pyrophosphohydrolase